MGIPQPLTFNEYSYPKEGKVLEYSVACHSPMAQDLSLSRLNVHAGVPMNKTFRGYLSSLLSEHDDVTDWIYLQNEDPFKPVGARVADLDEFDSSINLFSSHIIRTAASAAQGTQLEKGRGLLFNTRGAPILIFIGDGIYYVVVARRDSLIDRELVMTGHRSREHESVLDAVIEEYRHRGIGVDQLTLQGFFDLDAKANEYPSDHPEHGPFNTFLFKILSRAHTPAMKATENGNYRLSLRNLVHQQADARGITYLGCSHRILANKGFATPDHKNPALRGFSNLVIVSRPH